jgi:hypothetical protein
MLNSSSWITEAASQKNLSPADTDLIEIALTTLFSLDTLRQLLRDRSEVLQLLDRRLEWEEMLGNVEAERAFILAEVPKFIVKARWVRPLEPVVRPHHHHHHHHQRHAPGSPTQSQSTTATTSSAMSRMMRSEILALDLAKLTPRLNNLVHSALPKCAKALDALIDCSPTPVPDAWLDRQDALEANLRLETEGLTTFLAELVRQWRRADEFHHSTKSIRDEATSLHRDVEEALLKLPERARAGSFRETVGSLRTRSTKLRKAIMVETPRPIHARVADQSTVNGEVVAALLAALDDANKALELVAAASDTYSFASEALERAMSVQVEAQTCLDRLAYLASELDGFLVVLEDERCLAPDDEEPARRRKGEEARAEVESKAVEADAIMKRASESLVELQKARVDPNVRRDLKDVIQGLSDSLSKALDAAKRRRKAEETCDVARAYANKVQQVHAELSALAQLVEQEVVAARWSPSSSNDQKGKGKARDWSDEVVGRIGDVSKTVEASLASQLLDGLAPRLRGHLEFEADNVRADVQAVDQRVGFLLRLRRQTIALDDIEQEAAQLQSGVVQLSQELRSQALKGLFAYEEASGSQSQIEEDAIRFIESLPSRVPLVSTQSLPARKVSEQSRAHRRVSSRRVSQSVLGGQSTTSNGVASDEPESLDRTARNVANSNAAALSGALDDLQVARRELEWARKIYGFDGVLDEHEAALSALNADFRDFIAGEKEELRLTDLHVVASERVAALSRTRVELDTLKLEVSADDGPSARLFREREARLTTIEETAKALVRDVENAMDLEAKREAEARRLQEEEDRRKQEVEQRRAAWDERVGWVGDKLFAGENALKALEADLDTLKSVLVEGADFTRTVSIYFIFRGDGQRWLKVYCCRMYLCRTSSTLSDKGAIPCLPRSNLSSGTF